MKKNTNTGSRLFFIEFLIVLFFFLIISTVCLRLFAKAHVTTRNANALSHAQSEASSVAAFLESEEFQADTFYTVLSQTFPEAVISESEHSMMLYYDRDFKPCTANEYFFVLTSNFASSQEADIRISDTDSNILYQLSVSVHKPITRGEALK